MSGDDRTIWKFPLALTDEQEIEMPRASEILHVGVQQFRHSDAEVGEELYIWALVFPEAPAVKRKIYIFGTGQPFKTEGSTDYIGTAQMCGSTFVWHVFALDETWRKS